MGRRCTYLPAHVVDGMISVVIPAYNEERALPATLRQLFEQAGSYEVIVVDGEATIEPAKSFGAGRSIVDCRPRSRS